MNQSRSVIQWLLGDDNPAVKYRTLLELLEKRPDDETVLRAKELILNWLPQTADSKWMDSAKNLRMTYNLTALAECALTREDIEISRAVAGYFLPARNSGTPGLQYNGQFDSNCCDAMVIRALVALGYGDHKKVRGWLKAFSEYQLPDGGMLCLHRIKKLKYSPKSCMKDNLHILLMLAVCRKQGLEFKYTAGIVNYFLKRQLFYRSDAPRRLVLSSVPGKRMIDSFFPAEPMRVGLPQILYSLSILGAGQRPEMAAAWQLIESKKDSSGKYRIEGTVAKSYLPRERVGKASKWVTLYVLLARKHAANPPAQLECG